MSGLRALRARHMVASVSAPFDELTAGRRAWIARAGLSELASTIGRPGRAAVAARPDLLARVDQHAAAIRESLGGSLLDPVALAGYSAAIRDAARDAGDPLDEWSSPSWAMLRLLAVCSLVP
ncbi:hypothetical protein GCM10022255_031270 [Dactylosporangium darangshiense]|uniref:Uncharacterized protein n=1 Tax=Dactylosporangium darangshiense TaxID=579108 RepID=A0ABP8D781_9ACTN